MSFPVKTFREALENTKLIYKKMNTFFLQCKRHNMAWIYGITEEFYKIFNEKQSLILKVNSIYAIQFFLQLAQYPLIILFQVYLLPLISQAALFKIDARSYSNTSQYFTQKGYSANTPNIQQLSHNYILLASEFIFNASYIKPYRAFYSSQMNQLSMFKKLANKLVEKGVQQKQRSKQQTQKVQFSREEYLKNLTKFQSQSQPYVLFFMKKVEQYIIQGVNFKQALDFKKILKFGDVILTSQAIGHCCQALQNQNLGFKRNSLLLIHDFVLWGDIEAIMMINYAEYIDDIFKRIAQVNGAVKIANGQLIYPQIVGQNQSKKQFYIDFLKILHTWAFCIPKNNFGGNPQQSKQFQPSPIFKLYGQLKQQKHFIFPDNPYLPKHKRQFDQNLKFNTQRNQLILKQLQQNADDDHSISKSLSLKPVNKLQKYGKISQIKQQRQSSLLTYEQVQKVVQENQQLLNSLKHQQSLLQIQKKMVKLNKFAKEFDQNLQGIQQSVDEQQLDELITRGYICIQKIMQIQASHQDLKNNRINLKNFQQIIRQELSRVTTNRSYADQYKSRKSKFTNRSSELKSMNHSKYHNQFQSKHNENNSGIQRHSQNLSYQKKVNDSLTMKKQKSKNQNGQIQQPKIQKFDQSSNGNSSVVSKSSHSQVSQKEKNSSKKSVTSQEPSQNQYDYQLPNYGFKDFGKQKSKNLQNNGNRQSSKLTQQQKDRIESIQKFSSKIQSQKQSQIQSVKNHIRTQKDSSKSRVQFENEKQSSIASQPTSKNKISSSKSKTETLKQSNNNNASDMQKSKQKDSSSSFFITADNIKKIQEQEKQNQKLTKPQQVKKKIQTLKANPHKIQQVQVNKELHSFNHTITNYAGMSKQTPSSDRISSIQQKNFKFQMFNSNSQDKVVFDDDDIKQGNQQIQKMKQVVEQEENPGFQIVFKNKSNINSDGRSKISHLSKNTAKLQKGPINTDYQTISQNLSPNKKINSRQSSRNNSQIKSKQSKNKMSQSRQSSKLNIYTAREPSQKNLNKQKIPGTNSIMNNSNNNLNRSSQNNSINKSHNQSNSQSHRSLKRSQTSKNKIKQQQPQNNVVNNPNITKKPRQYFQHSSFVSSEQTPKIMQRSSNYYENNENSFQRQNEKGSRLSTSPKMQRVSFVSNSKQNISNYSKNPIIQRDQKSQIDPSNIGDNKSKMSKLQKTQQSKISNNSQSMKKKIQLSNEPFEDFANKEIQQIKKLQQKLAMVQNQSKNLFEFQKKSMLNPQKPRYLVSPRSPRFRNLQNVSSSYQSERISLTTPHQYMSPPTKHNFDLNSNESRAYMVTPQGKLFDQKQYKKYFQQIKPKKQKKRLLRNKDLAYKNQYLQIGITLLRERNRLKVIYFITVQQCMSHFKLTTTQNQKVKVSINPKQLTKLQAKKQYKIYCLCQISQFPYMMPNVYFQYKNQSNNILPLGYNLNQSIQKTVISQLMPIYFLKFIQIKQISHPLLEDHFQSHQLFRTKQFPYSTRILKKGHDVTNYIPNLLLLSQNNSISVYCGLGTFFKYSFIFKINIKLNRFMYVQSVTCCTGEDVQFSNKVMEYFMCCVQELFIKDLQNQTQEE